MTVGFWVLALLWLPAVETGNFVFSVVPWMDHADPRIGYSQFLKRSVIVFLILAPMGLPGALLCRELWRLGYRRMAWLASAVACAAAVAIISSDGELIYSLQWTVGVLVLAPNLLTMVLRSGSSRIRQSSACWSGLRSRLFNVSEQCTRK